MTAPTADDLRRAGFRGEVRAGAPLAPFTTWKIGGPADLLANPTGVDDLSLAVAWARDRGLPWRILGNGSNLLVHDAGVRALVIRLRRTLEGVQVDGPRIVAEAGASFPRLSNLAASRGLAGLEFAAGIPGTLGGAVFMNAGWHEFELGNHVEWVEVLHPDGRVERMDREACGFGYRTSVFRRTRPVILRASILLKPESPESVRRRMEGFLESRKANQPTELPSCGSVFLKPPGDYAGRLIEAAGLKGLRVGDIQVSDKHANFFVNLGRGRARDVLELVERVEEEVRRRFGVQLEREFEIWT